LNAKISKCHPVYTFELSVRMRNSTQSIIHFTPELMKKLIKWYKKSTADLFEILGVDTKITKIGYQCNKIKMTIKTLDMTGPKDMMGIVVSPDDDGNYPMHYNGQDYLISGNETHALDSITLNK